MNFLDLLNNIDIDKKVDGALKKWKFRTIKKYVPIPPVPPPIPPATAPFTKALLYEFTNDDKELFIINSNSCLVENGLTTTIIYDLPELIVETKSISEIPYNISNTTEIVNNSNACLINIQPKSTVKIWLIYQLNYDSFLLNLTLAYK